MESIKKIKLSNPKTNAKLIESIVSGSIIHFKIPKDIRSQLLSKGYKFTKSPNSKNSFFKAICLGFANYKKYENTYCLFVLREKPIVVIYSDKRGPTVKMINILSTEEFRQSFIYKREKIEFGTIPGIFK